MKIAMRIPLVRALNESIAKGLIHENDGSTAVPAGLYRGTPGGRVRYRSRLQ